MLRHNIGISLPRTGEDPRAPVYVDGSNFVTLQGPMIVPDFIRILDEYIDAHYASREEESVAQFQV